MSVCVAPDQLLQPTPNGSDNEVRTSNERTSAQLAPRAGGDRICGKTGTTSCPSDTSGCPSC